MVVQRIECRERQSKLLSYVKIDLAHSITGACRQDGLKSMQNATDLDPMKQVIQRCFVECVCGSLPVSRRKRNAGLWVSLSVVETRRIKT